MLKKQAYKRGFLKEAKTLGLNENQLDAMVKEALFGGFLGRAAQGLGSMVGGTAKGIGSAIGALPMLALVPPAIGLAGGSAIALMSKKHKGRRSEQAVARRMLYRAMKQMDKEEAEKEEMKKKGE